MGKAGKGTTIPRTLAGVLTYMHRHAYAPAYIALVRIKAIELIAVL